MKKCLQLFGMVILTLIVIISLYVCYVKIIKKENMVFIGKYGMAVILSGSMEPKLSIYDLVIVKKTDDYQKDDIVVFDEESNLVVHRIIESTNEFVTTKGDANNIKDKSILKSSIKGKVIKNYKNIGKYVLDLSNPVYIALLIIIVSMYDILFKKRITN